MADVLHARGRRPLSPKEYPGLLTTLDLFCKLAIAKVLGVFAVVI
jgi:hypothetical protein